MALFIDTETSGLPNTHNLRWGVYPDYKDVDKYANARIVQFSMLITDTKFKCEEVTNTKQPFSFARTSCCDLKQPFSFAPFPIAPAPSSDAGSCIASTILTKVGRALPGNCTAFSLRHSCLTGIFVFSVVTSKSACKRPSQLASESCGATHQHKADFFLR